MLSPAATGEEETKGAGSADASGDVVVDVPLAPPTDGATAARSRDGQQSQGRLCCCNCLSFCTCCCCAPGGWAYKGAKALAGVAVASFFRQVKVAGQANVPKDGPLLVIANHANQFVDPMMLLTFVPRDVVSFLIAAKSTKKPVIGPISRALRSVPVVRAQDAKKKGVGTVFVAAEADRADKSAVFLTGSGTEFTKQCAKGGKVVLQGATASASGGEMVVVEVVNDTRLKCKMRDDPPAVADAAHGVKFLVYPKLDQHGMFDTVFDTLCDNRCIGIFPEGGSHDRTSLLPLKAGVAIMALGAIAKGAKNLRILPVGLNYVRASRYQSRVLVNIGPTLGVDPALVEQYKTDKRGASGALLEQITASLDAVTVQAEDWDTLQLIRTARRLYEPAGMRLPVDKYVELTRRFGAAYHRFAGTGANPEFDTLLSDVRVYMEDARGMGLSDKDIVNLRPPNRCATFCRSLSLLVWTVLLWLVVVPISVPGLLLGTPVVCWSGRGIRKKMEAARAGSRVKVAGRDVGASVIISRAVTATPMFLLCYAIVATVLLAIFVPPEDLGMEPLHHGLALVGVFFALLLFVIPFYMFMSQRALNSALDMCRDSRSLRVQCCTPSIASHLRQRRRKLQLRVREMVNKLGPEMGADIWNNRVISEERLARDTRRSDRRLLDTAGGSASASRSAARSDAAPAAVAEEK